MAGRIGPVTAKNRFYQVPHCNGGGYRDPSAAAEMRRIKSEGGWGVIFTEQVEIHHSSEITPFIELRIWDEDDMPGGNPGGCITGTDEALGETWYFVAPRSDVELLPRAINGTIRFGPSAYDGQRFAWIRLTFKDGRIERAGALAYMPQVDEIDRSFPAVGRFLAGRGDRDPEAVPEPCGELVVLRLDGVGKLLLERLAHLVAVADALPHLLKTADEFVVGELLRRVVAGEQCAELVEADVDLADRRGRAL